MKMAVQKPLVLIVDDGRRSFHALTRLISPKDYTPVLVPEEEQALGALAAKPDREKIVILDLKSSCLGGGGFLHQARRIAPRAAFLITGPLDVFLYFQGDFYEFKGTSLKTSINSVLNGICEKMGLGQDRGPQPDLQDKFGVMVGKSAAMNDIYRLIANLAPSSAAVLITGESGTGKELAARTIHQTGPRQNRPFVALNCGAIPPGLMESELFGHERGAFTTAVAKRKGKFEAAHQGTMFLDEIGELDKDLQVKLLRVLEEKEFQRVGGNVNQKVDVRIIAATSRDLARMVRQGSFRPDLFYRLNVVPIRLPALRERKEDIPLLLNHFFRIVSTETGRPGPALSSRALTALYNYNYPGNVRELINLVQRLFVLPLGKVVTLDDLPLEVRNDLDGPSGESAGLLRDLPEGGVPLGRVEKELIVKTLNKTGGNKKAAARMLGMTRRWLYLRISRYGLAGSEDVTCGDSNDQGVTNGDIQVKTPKY